MGKLTEWLGGLSYKVLCGNPDSAEISEVVYDSRKAAPGTVFVCMAGSKTDSHAFLPQVYEAGCRVFVVEKDAEELCRDEKTEQILGKYLRRGVHGASGISGSGCTDSGCAASGSAPDCVAPSTEASNSASDRRDIPTVIAVGNGREALAFLSAARFGHPAEKMTVIGLTGTKGKTTVSYMLKSILEDCGEKVGVIGTNGCEIAGVHYPTKNTTPESYEINERFARMVEAGCRYAVMECSSQGFKMHRTDGIVFDYGIFLNISPDHIGPLEHADFDEYLSCKAKIFAQSKTGIINADDMHAPALIAAQNGRKDFRMLSYGMAENSERPAELKPDLTASSLHFTADGTFVGTEFEANGLINDRLRLSLPGAFNVSNALAALCVCSLLGLPEDKVRDALSRIHVNGRMEIVYRSDRFQVLVDYAHNEVSMESLLETLRQYRPKRLVVVFGCGGNRAKDRRTGMGAAAARAADLTILTADNSRFEKTEDIIADIREAYLSADGDRKKLLEIPDRREAIGYAVRNAQDGDMIAVIGKGHEDYQEICGERTHFSDREEILKAAEALE